MDQTEYVWTFQAEDWHWWFVCRRQLAAGLLEHRLTAGSSGRILDVGCGTGGNLSFLSQWGVVTGLDLSLMALDFARHRRAPHLVQGAGQALPFPSQTFDLVTAFDVLYHRWITDDRPALQECYRVLRPQGWLLLTNPALPWLWSNHDEIYGARERYVVREASQRLSKIGFEPRMCAYTNLLLLPLLTLLRLGARWWLAAGRIEHYRLAPWLNRWLIRLYKPETKWLSSGGQLPLGSSLVCLAQKPTRNTVIKP